MYPLDFCQKYPKVAISQVAQGLFKYKQILFPMFIIDIFIKVFF
jgi:hypothetical protein